MPKGFQARRSAAQVLCKCSANLPRCSGFRLAQRSCVGLAISGINLWPSQGPCGAHVPDLPDSSLNLVFVSHAPKSRTWQLLKTCLSHRTGQAYCRCAGRALPSAGLCILLQRQHSHPPVHSHWAALADGDERKAGVVPCCVTTAVFELHCSRALGQ